MAVVDYFLKLDGIDGESSDAKHKGEIDIESWSWGEKQTGTSHLGGGAGAGRVQMQDFHCVARHSKASPKVMLACASGEHIKSATLTCRKAGKDQQEFLKFTMTDLLISSYQAGGSNSSDIIPQDQWTLNFGKIEMEYKEQAADGTLKGPIKTGWNVKENKKV